MTLGTNNATFVKVPDGVAPSGVVDAQELSGAVNYAIGPCATDCVPCAEPVQPSKAHVVLLPLRFLPRSPRPMSRPHRVTTADCARRPDAHGDLSTRNSRFHKRLWTAAGKVPEEGSQVLGRPRTSHNTTSLGTLASGW